MMHSSDARTQLAAAFRRRGPLAVAAAAAITAAGCGAVATGKITASSAPKRATWVTFTSADRPLDLVGPRAGGSLVLAAAGRLMLLTPSGQVQPFAPKYVSPGGEEPYIALSPGGCYGRGTVYALRLTSGPGVVAISAGGAVRRVAALKTPGLIDGIAFDRTGDFGHKLLVTINNGTRTTVDAIGCNGKVTTITHTAPRLEGGIAVAPASFGRFAGDLIGPDERSGKLIAVAPNGRSSLLASSGLPHGGDVGVESEGFVPGGAHDAFVADRLTPGNPHPGDTVILRVTASALKAAGVRPGDLLVTTEGGALTDAISCSSAGCQVRFVATGPKVAHAEGHIAFR